jgi:hypothetical protein
MEDSAHIMLGAYHVISCIEPAMGDLAVEGVAQSRWQFKHLQEVAITDTLHAFLMADVMRNPTQCEKLLPCSLSVLHAPRRTIQVCKYCHVLLS